VGERRCVGLAFHAYAAARPELAADLRADTARLQDFLAGLIRAAQRTGDAGDVDPEHAARVLLALVEGLTMQVLGQGYDPVAARDVFDRQLATLFREPPG
jgi:hypothetical protein